MANLRTMKKHEVFLSLKKDLAMAVQAIFQAEELVNISHRQMKDEEGKQVAAVEAFNVAEKRVKELNAKLLEPKREKKSAEAVLEGVERQAETQFKQLRQAENELVAAREQIKVLKKKLEDAEKAKDQTKQDGYDVKVAETEEALKAEVSGVCRAYLPPGVECGPKPCRV